MAVEALRVLDLYDKHVTPMLEKHALAMTAAADSSSFSSRSSGSDDAAFGDAASHYSFERFRWAWGVVQTRACYLRVSTRPGDNSCLVPVADLLNHANVEVRGGG